VFKALVAALLALSVSNGVQAQTYPVKPVRLVAPAPAGGTLDIVSRMVGQRLSETLGQQFLTDNRAGAAGNIAASFVAKAPADGYTLLIGSAQQLSANSSIFARLPFDPIRDFAPITPIVFQSLLLVLHPSVPARNIQEFIALSKSGTGKLSYSSGGPGASGHMAAELFIMTTGAKLLHVPYKGTAQALTDLIGGHVDLTFAVVPSALPFIQNGKLRALAVTSPQRSPVAPDVRTMREAGLPGCEFGSWIGLLAPSATPKDIIVKLHDEVEKAVKSGLHTKLTEIGFDVTRGTPEQFAALITKDAAIYARLVKASGMALQ
jgi:tripartite-type tricarboxylate transporter receptor subunit TctC